MFVLNAGVPRSGTVLVNAILRQLIRDTGAVLVQTNPAEPEMAPTLRRLRETGDERYKTILVHTHTWDAEAVEILADAPYSAAFLNYRDPRDVCVSLMRLHDHDFGTAAEMTEAAFAHFAAFARDLDAMVIPYEYLMADKPGHIFQIARRLGLWPGRARVAEIDRETSTERHRDHMEKVRAGAVDNLKTRPNRNRDLVEDPKTLINDRHIQSGATGRWRAELSAAQQKDAAARFAGILERYGYTE